MNLEFFVSLLRGYRRSNSRVCVYHLTISCDPVQFPGDQQPLRLTYNAEARP